MVMMVVRSSHIGKVTIQTIYLKAMNYRDLFPFILFQNFSQVGVNKADLIRSFSEMLIQKIFPIVPTRKQVKRKSVILLITSISLLTAVAAHVLSQSDQLLLTLTSQVTLHRVCSPLASCINPFLAIYLNFVPKICAPNFNPSQCK